MNHWRIPTWLLVIWTGSCIGWVAAGPRFLPFAEGASPMAPSAAVALVFFFWIVGIIVLGLIWFVTRRPLRP